MLKEDYEYIKGEDETMTQKERRDLIRSLKKEIKAQQAVILESIECETMTPAEFANYAG